MNLRRPAGHYRRRLRTPESLEAREMLTLAITEINFNPYDSKPELGESEQIASDEYEFIELMNRGESTLNLSSYELRKINDQGVDFAFGAINLEPNERVVVVENLDAFRLRYGSEIEVAGSWSGGLSNDREIITLVQSGTIVEQVEYKSTDKWPTRPDGLGASLERKDFLVDDLSDPDVWRSSVEFGGSPGSASRVIRDSPIIINEVLAHTDVENGQMDAVELRNTSDAPVDVSGWYLTDNVVTKTLIFSIPNGTVIPAGGYAVFTEADFNPNMQGFALSEFGEPSDPDDDEGGLWLLEGGTDGRPEAFADRVTFAATFNGVSVGNVNNIDDSSFLTQLESLTFGRANAGHRVGEVVINEIQYHPADDDVNKEFIELRSGAFAIDMGGWRIADAIDIVFPEVMLMDANSSIILVAFDPVEAPDIANAFRAYYGIDTSVELVGPWGANEEGDPDRLSNSGERITLERPEFDQEVQDLFIAVDQVNYGDALPWPDVADGMGGSIQRMTTDLYGNFPMSWEGITPTPGDQPFDVALNPEIFIDTPVAADIGSDGSLIRGAADVDLYRFTPTETRDYAFRASGVAPLGARTMLRIFALDGTELAMQKPSDESTEVNLSVPLQAGQEYLVGVNGDSDEAGNYDPLTGKGIAAGTTPGSYELSVSGTEPLPPWQNPILAEDVNGDQIVAPFDALLIINRLNSDGGGKLPEPGENEPPPFLDVNGDGFVALVDALLVINYLNEGVAAVPAKSVRIDVTLRLEANDSSDVRDSSPTHFANGDLEPSSIAVDLLFEAAGSRPTELARDLDVKSSELTDLDLSDNPPL